MTRIDIERLITITEQASRLNAQWRGQYEALREIQDEIREVDRERLRSRMRHAELQLRSPLEEEGFEKRLEHLRRLASMRQHEVDTAGEISSRAGRLAEACLEYARKHGVMLPGDAGGVRNVFDPGTRDAIAWGIAGQ